MRTEKIILSLLCTCIALGLYAQGNGFDMQVMSEQEISGTTRYVGMGGAMAAVGGDVSAVKDNPAALGIFRRSEVTFTLGYQLTHSLSPKNIEGRSDVGHNLRLPDISWVFNHRYKEGSIQNNFMLGYRRLKNINRIWQTKGENLPVSQTDLMAWQTNGLVEADLEGTSAYDDANIGWLSKMGYDAWLTAPTEVGSKEWMSLENGNAKNELMVREDGFADQFTFGWGLGANNRFYIGAAFNLVNLRYDKYTSYSEAFLSSSHYELKSICKNTGVGINLQVGMIARPSEYVRLGLALQSPTWMQIKTTTGDNSDSSHDYVHGISAYIAEGEERGSYTSVPVRAYAEEASRKTPIRAVGGVAVQLGNAGMISLEYDYQHGFERHMTDEHMLKAGGEMVLSNVCFLNMGYACNLHGRFKQHVLDDGTIDDEGYYWPGLTTTRTDTDFRHYGARHYASAGLSFRNGRWVAGISYQFSCQQQFLYAHYAQMDLYADYDQANLPAGALDVRTTNMTHRIAFTLAYRY